MEQPCTVCSAMTERYGPKWQPTIKKLDSGFWFVRISLHQFIQWPCGRPPTKADGFGWVSDADIAEAARLAESAERAGER